jgi:hypothetical protein
MFIRLTNGTPEAYTIGQLRRGNPNVSFPKGIPAETLAEYSVYKVKQTTAPQIDSKTHRHTQTVELVDGEWAQVWASVELPLDRAAENIRAHRGYLLSKTDWMALSDNTMTPEWASYRQALRDITEQAGFPYSVVWPTKP